MLVKMPEKTTCIPARKRASAQTAFAIWKSEPNPEVNINCRIPGDIDEFTVTEEAVKGGA
jgi:hypothetical protein